MGEAKVRIGLKVQIDGTEFDRAFNSIAEKEAYIQGIRDSSSGYTILEEYEVKIYV